MIKLMTYLLSGVLLLLAGCDDADPYFNREVSQISANVATASHLVVVDYGHDKAMMLGLTEKNIGSVRTVPVPKAPIFAEKRKGTNEVLILSEGNPGNKNAKEQPASLTRLLPNGQTISYALGSKPFDTLISSPDGKYVILLRRNFANFILENMNEIAIVNLLAEPEDPTAVIFKTVSGTPQNVFFSDNFKIGDEPRNIVAIAAQGALFILDADHFERQETCVYLGQNLGTSVLPTQVIFDSESSRLYLRSEYASDIFALRLTSRPSQDDKNDFSTAVDIVGVGGRATDMSLYHENGDGYLFVTAIDPALCAIVNVATGKIISIKLGVPMEHALLFEKGSGANLTRHALMWPTYAEDFYVFDFAGAEDDGERNIRFVGSTGQWNNSVYPTLVDNRMLVIHDSGLTMIDLSTETFIPYTSKYPLHDSYLDTANRKFWVAIKNQDQVAYIDMNDGSTGEMIIDETVKNVTPAFEAGKLIIEHKDSLGYLTIVDVAEPTREAAVSVKGYLFNDIL